MIRKLRLQEVDKGYSRQVYAALDDAFTDSDGKVELVYIADAVDMWLFNTQKLYKEIFNNRRKATSIAYEALIDLFQDTVDGYDVRVRVTSEMVKQWFKRVGLNYIDCLKPVVDKIEEEREEARQTKKESIRRPRRRSMKESADRKWLNTELSKEEFAKLRTFLKSRGIKYEPSEAGNLVHVEIYCNSNECKEINDFIDTLDESYRRPKSFNRYRYNLNESPYPKGSTGDLANRIVRALGVEEPYGESTDEIITELEEFFEIDFGFSDEDRFLEWDEVSDEIFSQLADEPKKKLLKYIKVLDDYGFLV